MGLGFGFAHFSFFLFFFFFDSTGVFLECFHLFGCASAKCSNAQILNAQMPILCTCEILRLFVQFQHYLAFAHFSICQSSILSSIALPHRILYFVDKSLNCISSGIASYEHFESVWTSTVCVCLFGRTPMVSAATAIVRGIGCRGALAQSRATQG